MNAWSLPPSQRITFARFGPFGAEHEDRPEWEAHWSYDVPIDDSATRHLLPLTSAQMIQREALRLRNCIGDYIPQVLSGTHYFSRWNGAEPAAVCLQRDGSAEWRLGECAGIGNRPLSPSTGNQIAHVIRAVLVGYSVN